MASCKSFCAVTQVLAISIPDLMRLFADDLDHRCKMRWVVVWLLECFSRGLIHHAVVMSPGCKALADSTTSNSSHDVGLNVVDTNSARVG